MLPIASQFGSKYHTVVIIEVCIQMISVALN